MTDNRTTEHVTIQVVSYFADGERYPSIIGVKADGDEYELAYVKKSEQAISATLGSEVNEYKSVSVETFLTYNEMVRLCQELMGGAR